MPINDADLDLLIANVPMASKERVEVERLRKERYQKRVLQGLYDYNTQTGVKEAEKELFIRAYGEGMGVTLGGETFDEYAQTNFGNTNRAKIFEAVSGTLAMLHGEKGVAEYLKLDADEQTRIAVEEENKRRNDDILTFPNLGTNAPRFQRSPVSSGEEAGVVADRKKKEAAKSPKYIWAENEGRMEDSTKAATMRMLMARDPAKVMDSVDDLILGMNPEQLRIFKDKLIYNSPV